MEWDNTVFNTSLSALEIATELLQYSYLSIQLVYIRG